ncbi:MAG: hypothetical protein JMN27_09600 [gamma proteobacterium endosymbiont of Lamellibrachia anaximandri]|nr:hypothetical protein [gamma proteobacterium endosymbiont of Lamellibrachia anaximandri]MBL3534074.1 hypothetical protein [gamma proteobacterium endosymbiont of Lamellibrachia anaximandri]
MAAESHRNIDDPNLSSIIELSHKDSPLLIAFGGVAGNHAPPPFELYNLTRNLKANKIYLRDLQQVWYQSGVSGISTNIDETASYLRNIIDKNGIKKVAVFGNSMGGYAAIIIGVLINASSIHAFSPQTFIHIPGYIRNRDRISFVHEKFSDKYFDLKPTVKSHCHRCNVNIYYDGSEMLDSIHAMHLGDIENISLHPFSEGGHGLIRLLRDSGKLNNIIASALKKHD